MEFSDIEKFIEKHYQNVGIEVTDVSGPAVAGLVFPVEFSDIGSFTSAINAELSVVCDLKQTSDGTMLHVWPMPDKQSKTLQPSNQSHLKFVAVVFFVFAMVYFIVAVSGRHSRHKM